MKHYHFKGIYTEAGWISPAWVDIDTDGTILNILASEPLDKKYEAMNGWFLPGFQNAHSHIFQYAMAGLNEHRTRSNDSFWSWRRHMYHFANAVTPEDLESIACYAYLQMLKNGITAVAEFHYLHHDTDGTAYTHRNEMGERLMRAAQKVGIELCLIPIFYKYANFNQPHLAEQKRFVSDNLDEYWLQVEEVQKASLKYQCHYGVGAHSIRAAAINEIQSIFARTDVPIHIHISEQRQEIEDCQKHTGTTPIDYLQRNFALQDNHFLVHATHATQSELMNVAKAGANIVICPSTEANLGDGVFDYQNYAHVNGRWCIGTDSHICINPAEEMRLFEYSQRLSTMARNIIQEPFTCTGQNLFHEAWRTGARSVGVKSESCIGKKLTGFVLDGSDPLYEDASPEHIMSKYVFCAHTQQPQYTIIDGEIAVDAGQHHLEEGIKSSYISTLKRITSTL